MKKKTFLISAISVIFTVGIALALFTKGSWVSPWANAFITGNRLGGYAWSSNIGWIGFDQVTVDKNGNLGGYAWSSNIGWIDVNPTSGYPEAPTTGLRIDAGSGAMSGWMRAVSYGGGWDGWIKVTDAKVSQGGYIKNNAGTEGGWAWGGDVVGWVQFYNGITGSGVVVPWAAFGTGDELKGYAWSSNIGWISFNCADAFTCGSADYKVVVDDNGDLSGYAWSSNIGWIDVNPAGVGSRPSDKHGVRFDINDSSMSGWMRAVSYGGGWDGWIKVTDAKVSQGGYIKNNAGTEGGWAWGGDVVGWVQFYDSATNRGVLAPHVDCDFMANPANIVIPQTAKLAWNCNSRAVANGCSIDGGVGSNMPTTGNKTVRPAASTMYTLTCKGLGGPVVKTASVLVGKAPAEPPVEPGVKPGTTPGTGTGTKIRIHEVIPGQ